jgi:transcriptional regulator with XRE-family HTH domain
MNAIQLKMARAGMGWGVRELAEKAGVTANTVNRIEHGSDAKTSTINAIQTALEMGEEVEPGKWVYVEFIAGDGVRIRFGDPPSSGRDDFVRR